VLRLPVPSHNLTWAPDPSNTSPYKRYAGTKERIAIIEELIKDLLPLVKSKYGKFVVFKILKYSTNAQKQMVMKAVKGQVLHLVKHKEGAHFLDTLFSDYCNEKARAALIQEFFGPEYALLGDAEGKTLKEIFKTLDAERKKELLKDSMCIHSLAFTAPLHTLWCSLHVPKKKCKGANNEGKLCKWGGTHSIPARIHTHLFSLVGSILPRLRWLITLSRGRIRCIFFVVNPLPYTPLS